MDVSRSLFVHSAIAWQVWIVKPTDLEVVKEEETLLCIPAEGTQRPLAARLPHPTASPERLLADDFTSRFQEIRQSFLGQACSKSLGEAAYASESPRSLEGRQLALFTSSVVASSSRSHSSFLVPPPRTFRHPHITATTFLHTAMSLPSTQSPSNQSHRVAHLMRAAHVHARDLFRGVAT